MKFHVFGDKRNPVMIMLPGSFCSAASMDYLYEKLKSDFYIIVPDYNGHYKDSVAFTTRKDEASEIKKYIQQNNLTSLHVIYGQSMGAEIAIELADQLLGDNILVKDLVFDGAPCVKLSQVYKGFMYLKFKTLINMLRGKNIEEVLQWKFLDKFTNGDTASLRPMLESLATVTPYITNESIKNESECCYTFDFPKFPETFQHHMHFFYAREEKVYTACFKHVKKAYPEADFRVESGYGHLTYSVKNTDEYIIWLKQCCS